MANELHYYEGREALAKGHGLKVWRADFITELTFRACDLSLLRNGDSRYELFTNKGFITFLELCIFPK